MKKYADNQRSEYDFTAIERKWQKRWERTYPRAEDFVRRPKRYVLVEFPYPSGDGLHVGHVRSYAAFDALARYYRMKGENVFYPIGWDAFGLPTENYALKTGVHPRAATDTNITNFRRQMKALGLSFDWSREVDTTDPKYYRWTQWIFLQLFKKGLAYQATIPINWCPNDKIGLANEEVVNGKCERCGTEVTRRMQKQWMLKITAYAERLLKDLDTVDYLEKIKAQQVNWIGKSEGAEIRFEVKSEKGKVKNNDLNQLSPSRPKADPPLAEINSIPVFTTRPDTLFGATYLVVAPEHQLIQSPIKSGTKLTAALPLYPKRRGPAFGGRIQNWGEVQKYIKQAAKKSDLERTDLAKEKTGVELKGIKAVNPANGEEIPIWVADYVLSNYGTGAIMAVPAHDERDWEFAIKFSLPKIPVVKPASAGSLPDIERQWQAIMNGEECYEGEGIVINSGEYDGFHSLQAKKRIVDDLEKRRFARRTVQYKLRDWVFSRQHYWGEPIPIVHCSEHGAVPVPEDQLPVELPYVEKYQPSGTVESPLANVTEWVNTTCPECGKPAKRETDTMPNWAGSSWYYLRYCDPQNEQAFADMKKLKYWLPVDLYNGGMEHTVLHLLYSRFWHKFLYDEGFVPTPEPYVHRHSHGVVLAEDGRKMSKSYGNVINPDDYIREYGADSLRMYEMFMGPFEDTIPWSTNGLVGVYRFLTRVHDVLNALANAKGKWQDVSNTTRLIHQTVKKVTDDFERFRFNTAVSAMMEYFNTRDFAMKLNQVGVLEGNEVDVAALKKFLILLFPMAPHLASELWERLFGGDIAQEPWPTFDPGKLIADTISLVIQVNGKLRGQIEVPRDISEEEAVALARKEPNVAKYLRGEPKRVVYVRGKLINFVV